GNLYVSNPHNELVFSYMINGDWNTLAQTDDYRMNGNSQIVFQDDKAIEFQGGNEYRYFDNRSIKLTSERVDIIDYQQPWFHHYLKPDDFKNFKDYLFSKDLNGWFIINDNPNWNNKHIEADYTWVHFQLNCQQPFLSRMYVYGALSNWQCNEQS
ncbi:MAG: DUF5103 domain-containing protein, partial [Bacteroidales bacterium]|nr:DUF5103 domain-containing protein [Bacteroidales bacterium]